MNKSLVKQVKQNYRARFKSEFKVVCSPGRINLIGEHTDYNEGFVFPAAINKGIVLAIGKSNTNKSLAIALDLNETHEFKTDITQPIDGGEWRNYVIGVVAEIQKKGCTIGNFNCVFSGNIPPGSGMSSSAALENSFVFGLNALYDLNLSNKEMIFISQQAEHNYAGVQCGIMDQYASMFGVAKSALLLDCRTLDAKPYKLNFKNYKLILINTNVKHKLTESAYNQRRAVCEKIALTLGKKALRDVSFNELESIKLKLDYEDYLKALYVLEENKRVLKFSEAITKADLNELGQLFYRSH
ncbi:MAG: galactokinase, partial [Bacteroidia bacterium]|nr:galactokinase [Bacteroidia bacterium]